MLAIPSDLIGKISHTGIWDKTNNPLNQAILYQGAKKNGW